MDTPRNHGGCPPVGYRNARDAERKVVAVPHPKLAPLVRQAFRLAAYGGMNLRQVREEMVRQGLTSRTGGPLGHSALWSILTNPFYVGKQRVRGRVEQGMHEPLIDEATFNAVRSCLGKRRANARDV